MGKIRRMFPGGNTAEGFYSFHDNIIGEDREKLYILKGVPGGGKSSLMEAIANQALDKGYSIEYHHCPSDPESIDGVVIIELKIALVDGTFPHIIDPIYPGIKDELIDLGVFVNKEKLKIREEEIVEAKKRNKIAYERAFAYFKGAKSIYKLIYKNNIRAVDLNKVNKEIINLKEKIFLENKNQRSQIRHMFSAANTPEGYVDLTPTILKGLDRIYYIEGEIGNGQSLILESLKEEGSLRGHKMEIFYNPTIPEEIETIIIEDLKLALTCNGRAVDFSPIRINLKKHLNYKEIKEKDREIYRSLMGEGIENLKLAKGNHEILENAYGPAIDFQGINQVRERVKREIFKL